MESENEAKRAAAGAGGSNPADDDSSDDEDDEGIAKSEVGPLPMFPRLTKAAVEALRYRGEDVLRGITKAAVKEARAREVAQQLLNSERLKSYFESHEAEQVGWLVVGISLPPTFALHLFYHLH